MINIRRFIFLIHQSKMFYYTYLIREPDLGSDRDEFQPMSEQNTVNFNINKKGLTPKLSSYNHNI